jgi:hypothetical protein
MIRERDDLQTIPGIGPNMAGHLHRLGIRRVADLRGQSPEALYERDRELAGGRLDPCVLYTYRCAVYYASTERPDPALLKWWNWKDRASVQAPRAGDGRSRDSRASHDVARPRPRPPAAPPRP